ncbi:hypothetical protein NPX13_g9431 [Xylaria arbuscula]|uniref:Uncharacterized protein n=1 Tax=Xylaria arbuscula TaxID=114810 RepID=A0A9W8N6R0_9PEZI|nr:hypothetical protein NPX13_g9431 [Xylaria arbuscula]
MGTSKTKKLGRVSSLTRPGPENRAPNPHLVAPQRNSALEILAPSPTTQLQDPASSSTLQPQAPSPSPSSLTTKSRCSLSVTKSSFSFSGVVATERAMAPIVMRPRRCKFGAASTARQSSMVSAPGKQPDLESSPEVLTWTWMLSFPGAGDEDGDEDENADRNSPRYRSSSCAFFNVSTLETHQRLGILARFLQCPVAKFSKAS